MKVARLLSLTLPLIILGACSGGGDGSASSSGAPAWEKFRHDVGNSGQGVGELGSATWSVKWSVQIDPPATPSSTTPPAAGAPTGLPVSSSPAIAGDGTVYIGSEGGTLGAVNANGTVKWRLTSCDCPGPEPGMAENQPLGLLVASPAVYTFNNQTSVLIGSTNGTLFIVGDNGGTATCNMKCFQPNLDEFGTQATAQFVSSPTFSTNVTGSIAGIFLGATITDGAGQRWGKLYAVNNDGSQPWEFPRPDGARIGPVTSSPALWLGGTVYFTAADSEADATATDDNLYALSSNGALKWKSPIGGVIDPANPGAFASSPVAATQIYIATADGSVFSINPANGSPRWRIRPRLSGDEDVVFIASLAIGNPLTVTPTASPAAVLTPTPPPGASATPAEAAAHTSTPTPTPPANFTPTPTPPTLMLFGVTTSGALIVIDAATGTLIPPTGPLPTPIPMPVISSPALSIDSFLVFGANDGQLHVVNTLSGVDTPVALKNTPRAMGIRSSPAIASDGTIYIGADDGMLYAVGMQ